MADRSEDPIKRFLEWLLYKLNDHIMIDGLHLLGTAGELDRVTNALSLIERYDPVRYSRICRDLKFIQIAVLFGALGQYSHRTKTCQLERRYVLAEETTVELIASVIVHEATHARLYRIGIAYDEDQRTRIENICFRREMAFGKRLPVGEEVISKAQRTLDAAYDFSDSAMWKRHEDGGQEALRYLGAPSWLIRFVVTTGGMLRRWKLSRRKSKQAP